MNRLKSILLIKNSAYFTIVILGFIVYGNALFNNFVWDDNVYVIPNSIRYGLDLGRQFGRNIFNSFGYYRPVQAIYSALIFTLFGGNVFFYHFPQITLHIVNACLLFLFFKILLDKKISLFLSLIFLIHPMQVESVSYIAASNSVMFFLFGMVAVLISATQKANNRTLILTAGLLFFSLLSKEAGLVFIPLILLYSFLFRRRAFSFNLISSFLAAGLYAAIRFLVEGIYFYESYFVPIVRLSFIDRLTNIPSIIFYYISNFTWPVNLAVSQNWIVRSINLGNFYLPLLFEFILLVAGFIFGWYLSRKNREQFKRFIFFVAWFLLSLGMIVNIVPLDMTVADRWFYLPIAGFLGILGVVLSKFSVNTYKVRTVTLLSCIAILGLLSLKTIERNTDWQNEKTLLSHDIKISDDYNKELALGAMFISQGNYDQAIVHTKRSVEQNPYYGNLGVLGTIYMHNGDLVKAKDCLVKALSEKEQDSSLDQTYLYYARLLALYDQPEQAVQIINSRLLPKYPNVPYIWLLLAIAEYRQDHQVAAMEAVTRASAISNVPQTQYVYQVIENRYPVAKINMRLLE